MSESIPGLTFVNGVPVLYEPTVLKAIDDNPPVIEHSESEIEELLAWVVADITKQENPNGSSI